MPGIPQWTEILRLREEVAAAEGRIGDLQMSLYSEVYADRVVECKDPAYYSDITEPTAGLVSFMATIARRLGSDGTGECALFHLDQGKSHALVGLYHLGNMPDACFATDLGNRVRKEAEHRGAIELAHTKVVVLSADNMTLGATSPEFGPATTLDERFLWGLFDGDDARYHQHLADGPNKAALQGAVEAVGRLVLILLDEVMDYVLQLSDQAHLGAMPGEESFIGALMDAVDEVPQVAFVVVMISSEFDERGYTVEAEGFRDYIAARIERNGDKVAVTEAADFAAILYRRLFVPPSAPLPVDEVAAAWRATAVGAWDAQVFERLGAGRTLAGFRDRLSSSYPFHPDLMGLVKDDWSRHAGFQRVRSTVSIFALTAYYWAKEHRAGRWAPELIGVGVSCTSAWVLPLTYRRLLPTRTQPRQPPDATG
jgi:predicted AAA+ superfamily ATPase